MAAERRRKDSQLDKLPLCRVRPPPFARSFPCHWLPRDSVNYCQCVNCGDCPMRLTERDEIGGNRSGGGDFLCVCARARRQAGIFKGSCACASRILPPPLHPRRSRPLCWTPSTFWKKTSGKRRAIKALIRSQRGLFGCCFVFTHIHQHDVDGFLRS